MHFDCRHQTPRCSSPYRRMLQQVKKKLEILREKKQERKWLYGNNKCILFFINTCVVWICVCGTIQETNEKISFEFKFSRFQSALFIPLQCNKPYQELFHWIQESKEIRGMWTVCFLWIATISVILSAQISHVSLSSVSQRSFLADNRKYFAELTELFRNLPPFHSPQAQSMWQLRGLLIKNIILSF